MMRVRKLLWLAACLAVILPGGNAAAGSLFPFYENLQTDEGSFFAVRPFYSHTVVEEGEIHDVFWPLYSRKQFKDEQSSRALIFYFTHQFASDSETPRNRRWLFPVWFQGRDAAGEDYFAIFPLGGTIHEFLGRDHMSFVLFPMFGKSQINEVETTSVLWPIYSRTRGDGIQRDRVFPIIGKSILEGQYEKKFVLWPFWNSADYFYPDNPGKAWILFPICGRADMAQEQTLWVIPPFFRFTKGEKENRIFCPWPFVQKVESERHDKFYLWPLWGRDTYNGGLRDRSFLLWPFLWSERAEEADSLKTRQMILPFYFREKEVAHPAGATAEEPVNADGVTRSSYWKIWPLMSWQKEGDVSRFRLLELWPVKNSAPVERNWSPLWTLFKRTDENGLIRKDALWFLWHSEKNSADERKEWSVLKGLLGYKNEDGAKSMRLFWIPIGKK